jgi:type IV pilus assembly protein PilE
MRGFTLVELIIVITIIGILSAVAYPSYTAHVAKSNRTAAQGELLEMASLQEKIYLNSNAYSTSLTAAYTGKSDGGLGRAATSKSADGKYDFTMPVATAQSYTITATPVAGTTQAGDGTFSITSTGTRTCTGSAGGPNPPKWCKNSAW